MVRVDRDLKQRRRRRQRERRKSNRLRLAKHPLCTCNTLFCTFPCTTTAWNSTFCGGGEHKTTTFCFFSWTSIQSFTIQLLEKNCQHLTNWTRWNNRDKVWSSVTSLFSDVFTFFSICLTCNLRYVFLSFEFFKDVYSGTRLSLLPKLSDNTDRERKVEIFQLANFVLCFRFFVISLMFAPVFSLVGCWVQCCSVYWLVDLHGA